MAEPNARPRIVGLIADFAQDGAALAGAGLITAGAEMVYRPAGFIVGCGFLLIGAWLSARRAN